jgi:hypothetical protein
MKKIIVLSLVFSWFTISSCQKETPEASKLSAPEMYNILKSTSGSVDLYMVVAFQYNLRSNLPTSFQNHVHFFSKKTEAEVKFNGIPIAVLPNQGYLNDDGTTSFTPNYQQVTKEAIGHNANFSVANSSEVENFSTEIYVPQPIKSNFNKNNNQLNITWNVDVNIDNDFLLVHLVYDIGNETHNEIKTLSQSAGSGTIDVSHIPAGTHTTVEFYRGVYKDEKISGKLVRTVAYTYTFGGSFK